MSFRDRSNARFNIRFATRQMRRHANLSDEQKAAVDTVLGDSDMMDSFADYLIEDENERVGAAGDHPILDALTKLVQNFIADPQKYINIIMLIISLFPKAPAPTGVGTVVSAAIIAFVLFLCSFGTSSAQASDCQCASTSTSPGVLDDTLGNSLGNIASEVLKAECDVMGRVLQRAKYPLQVDPSAGGLRKGQARRWNRQAKRGK